MGNVDAVKNETSRAIVFIEVDYNQVHQLYLALVNAAMKKQPISYNDLLTRVSPGPLSRHLTYEDHAFNDSLSYLGSWCASKGLPPLNVLVCKNGNKGELEVGEGFWRHTPMGNVAHWPEDVKHEALWSWRTQCYDYFDKVSQVNNEMSGELNHMLNAIRDNPLFPDIEPAIVELVNTWSAAVKQTRISRLVNMDLNHDQVMDLYRWVRQHVFFDAGGAVVNYDREVIKSENERYKVTRTLVLDYSTAKDTNLITTRFRDLLDSHSVSLLEVEVLSIQGAFDTYLDFKGGYVDNRGGWNYSYTLEAGFDADIKAPDHVCLLVNPLTGATTVSASLGCGVTNLVLRVTAKAKPMQFVTTGGADQHI